jgi:membrane-associated phospholipid phosphatase
VIGMIDLERKAVTTKGLVSSSLLAVGFCTFSYYLLDIRISYYFRSINPLVEILFRYITSLGKSTWYLIISMIMFLASRYVYKNYLAANKAIFIFLTIAISGIINDIIKYCLGRYRPNALFYDHLYGFGFFGHSYSMTSFPSGHANTITAVMLASYFLIPKYRWLYIVIAVSVIASRVVLCEHYLSDVVFGAYLAILTTVHLKSVFVRRDIGIFPVVPKDLAL